MVLPPPCPFGHGFYLSLGGLEACSWLLLAQRGGTKEKIIFMEKKGEEGCKVW